MRFLAQLRHVVPLRLTGQPVTFGTFAIISLIYCVIGVRVLYQVVKAWPSLWDRTFTANDRLLIGQASFFLLVPISVALHEFGHAAAVWSFGGTVTDFGYYVFAGFVAYREPFSATQVTVVAAAGTAVNIVLCLAAVAAALLRRPPFRAPINELLIQFALISGVNALIVYPLLDFSSTLNGDFRQMYSFDAPIVSTVALIVHGSAIVFGVWAFRSRSFRARVNRATGRPPQAPAGNRSTPQTRPVDLQFAQPPSPFPEQSLLGRTSARFREAGERLVAGWPVPLQSGVIPLTSRAGALPSGVALLLRWQSPNDQRRRQLMVQSLDGSGLRVIGQAEEQAPGSSPARTNYLIDQPTMGDDDDLVMQLRLAMEEVESWRPGASG